MSIGTVKVSLVKVVIVAAGVVLLPMNTSRIPSFGFSSNTTMRYPSSPI